ncbi:MAG: UDP-glucose/GDP-mannose dehydrogenase family protein [Gemmatimonadetes bacterium]|nr:UDP-glucose/GDP-mannose dehydrogenase family protein [Gemmatimonadota bacterium]
MNLGVIGTGYVGLVAGTCFAEMGNRVICCDVDEDKIARLKRGEVPIYEPGLEDLIDRNAAEGRIVFTTEMARTVRESEVLFIAVGTPPGEDGSADLQYVMAVARSVGRLANGPKIVVNKSTVPVGTGARVAAILAEETDHPCSVVSNPEFLKEGAAIEDFMKPDRVVLGSDDPEALRVMEELYAPFLRTGKPILTMDIRSAEMTKYAANAMLAARITLMNEIANLCDLAGADVDKVRQGVGTDSRLGPSFLFPGLGYGGSCFPKDVRALEQLGHRLGYEPRMLQAVHEVNDAQKRRMSEKIRAHFGERLDGLRFAVWGLAFKPQTDDMREAPSLVVIEELLAAGAQVVAFDPEAIEVARALLGEAVEYASGPYDAVEGADALVVVTEWHEFRYPDFARIRAALRQPVVFDGRNVFPPAKMAELGFTYVSMGRPPVRVAEPVKEPRA